MEDDYKMEGCRTCGVFSPLQYNYLRPLFGENNEPNMQNMLQMLNAWNLQIQENDGMPQYICIQCLAQISQMYAFQRSCIDVQEQLRQWYFKEKVDVKIKLENVEEDHVGNESDFIYIDDDSNNYELQFNDPNKTVERLLDIKTEVQHEQPNDVFTVELQIPPTVSDSNVLQMTSSIQDVTLSQNSEINRMQEMESNLVKTTDTKILTNLDDILINELSDLNEFIGIECNQEQIQQDYWCDICNENFYNVTMQDIQDHKMRHTPAKLIKCTLCTFTCPTRQQLKQHKQCVHPIQRVKRNVHAHRSLQLGKRKADNKDECNTITKVMYYGDDTTEKEVSQKNSMDANTGEFVTFTFCTDDGNLICGPESNGVKVYSTETNNQEALKRDVHALDKSKFKCHVCSRSFGLQFNLNRHLERHKLSAK